MYIYIYIYTILFLYIFLYTSYEFSIRKLARIGYKLTFTCLLSILSNHCALWQNGDTCCLMIYICIYILILYIYKYIYMISLYI